MKIELDYKYDLKNQYKTDSKIDCYFSLDDLYDSKPYFIPATKVGNTYPVKVSGKVNDFYYARIKHTVITQQMQAVISGQVDPGALVPTNSTLLVKMFTSATNEQGQSCKILACVGFVNMMVLASNVGKSITIPLGIRGSQYGKMIITVKRVDTGGYKWTAISSIVSGDVSKPGDTVLINQRIASKYTDRIDKYMRRRLSYNIKNSEAVKCRYSYVPWGYFTPASFAWVKGCKTNMGFWENMYIHSLLDVLLRVDMSGEVIADLLEGKMNLKEFDKKYWKSASAKVKDAVLVLLFRKIANSIPYITDFVKTVNGKKPLEIFSKSCYYNKSADCEDYSALMMQLIKTFKRLPYKSVNKSSFDGLKELWLRTQTYQVVIVLWMVASPEVSGRVGSSVVTAHMNIIMIPHHHFLKNIVLPCNGNKYENIGENSKTTIKRIRRMLSECDSKIKKLIPYNKGKNLSEIKSSMKTLIVEGTGPMTGVPMGAPDKHAHRILRRTLGTGPPVTIYMYPGTSGKSGFFKSAQSGFCDMGLGNHCSFVFSSDLGQDKNKCNAKPGYGVSYKKLISMDGVKYILNPPMNNREVDATATMARFTLSAPILRLVNGNYKYGKQNDGSAALDSGQSLRGYVNGVRDFAETVVTSTPRYKSSKNKKKREALTRCMEIARKIRARKYRPSNTSKFSTDVCLYRLDDFIRGYNQISSLLVYASSILDIDFYLEDLTADICNVVIVVMTTKNK